jgi:hypothetical protein
VIAAVYARKSTDQSAVADEAKSVTRQIDHATAYATVKAGRCQRRASSSMTDQRRRVRQPARFVRLMAALKPRALSRCSSCPRSHG